MAATPRSTTTSRERTSATDLKLGAEAGKWARTFALVVGIVFLAVGVLGFIPGITTNVGDMEFAGHESGSELLGIFQVSVLHNIVHLLFGVAGVVASRRALAAVAYLLIGGAIYLLLAAYGFAVDHSSDANFVPVNEAANWLHVGLGVGMIGLGLVAKAMDLRDDSGPGRTRAATR